MADAPDPFAPPLQLKIVRAALRVVSAASPSTAARFAERLFMTPHRHTAPEREKTVIARATAFEVATGPSSAIRAWSWGEGPSVFLVHGWEGRGAQLAAFMPPLVAAGFRVIAWDAPGHGASDGKRSSLVHFAWGLRQMAAKAGAPHAVIAHSLGCAATTLALREGMTAQRLVFVAPPLEPADYTTRFGEIVGVSDDVIERMKVRIEERFLRRWDDYSLAAMAKEMTAPLLVFHDRDDRDTFLHEGAALADAWPGARLVATSGLGHRRILRDPAVVAMATEFISTAGGPAALPSSLRAPHDASGSHSTPSRP